MVHGLADADDAIVESDLLFCSVVPPLPWCAGTPGAGGASAVISGFLPVGPPIVA